MSSNKILDYYEKTNASFLHAHGEASTELLIGHLTIKPNEHILEIGFGTGATLVKIASRFADVHLYGIDQSKQMLAKARKRIKFCGVKTQIQLKQVDAGETLNIYHKQMDKIYIESVLGIQEDDELKSMIAKIKELLKPNGLLVINETIWKDDVSLEEINKINAACKAAFGIIQSNAKYNTKQKWHNLFTELGFSVQFMEDINTANLSKPKKNKQELLSSIYTKLGKLRGLFSGNLRLEMKQYKKSMSSIITHNRQVMTGVIFVLRKE